MDKRITILISILIFIVVIGGAYWLYSSLADKTPANDIESNLPSASAEPEKTLAEDFTVLDNEGNAVKLSDFLGKPVVLNFWASWCPPCRSEMPDFNEVYADYGDDVSFIMVNMTDGFRETQADGQAYVEENGYTFPVYFDTDGSAASAFDISAIPTTVFIDADGYIVTSHQGAMSKAELISGIDLITTANND